MRQSSLGPWARRAGAFWLWAAGAGERARSIPPLLVALLLIGLALRLYGITWDQGHLFHPDERSIYMRVDCMSRLLTKAPGYEACQQDAPFRDTIPGFPTPRVFLDAAKSPLNPHWYPLGNLLLYLLLLTKLAASPLVELNLQGLALVGRTLSALADVGTVALVYALGRKLYGRPAGLLAAALTTFAVTHIQHSHFYRPETFINLFVLASLGAMLRLLDRRRLRDAALLGACVGLAFAMKISMAVLLLPVAVTFGWLAWEARRLPPRERVTVMEQTALRALTAGVVAVGVYLLATPYALLAFSEFLADNLWQLDMVRNAGSVPFTVQYVGTPKFLYELYQTSVWGLGVPLGLVAWGGLVATVAMNARRPRRGQVLLLLWVLPTFFSVGMAEVKFLRYSFSVIPLIIVMGAGTLSMALERTKRAKPWGHRVVYLKWALVHNALDWLKLKGLRAAVTAATGAVVLATIFYALAFESIYARPHTAVQASRWMNATLPPGAQLLADNHWDEGIPDLGNYRVAQLPMFEPDTPRKMGAVATLLASGDYLVFYSNRTYGAIARVPDRYPLSSNYYRLLFSGGLGYELTASFGSYPGLWGVAFRDDPFRRARVPLPGPLRGVDPAPLTLDLGYADNDVITYDHPLVLVFRKVSPRTPEELLTLLLRPALVTGPKLTLVLTADELARQRQGGTWSELFDRTGLANRVPVLAWLLLVETVSLVAVPLGFLVFRGLSDRGYLLSKTLGLLLLAYGPWLLAALKLMGHGRASIFLWLGIMALGGGAVALWRRREMAAFFRARWRLLLLEEGLFLGAFGLFVVFRWANPDLWHPWRGGEKPMEFAYLNAVVRSTGMPPYDPWFAGGYMNYYYFGQAIVATLIKATGVVPEVAFNLAVPLLFALTAGGAFSVVYNLTEAWRLRRQGPAGPAWGPVVAGLLGSVLVVGVGNLGGAGQLLVAAWNWLRWREPFPSFDFWASSRMMPPDPPGFEITEFPYWSFLFADLHAHLIALPFTLLVVGCALNFLLSVLAKGPGWRSYLAPLLALSLAVGSLAVINTWDYPAYLLLAVASVVLATYLSMRMLKVAMVAMAIWQGTLLVVASYLAFLPFHLRYVAFDLGVRISEQQTALYQYVGIHGLFLFLVLTYLWREGRRVGARPTGNPGHGAEAGGIPLGDLTGRGERVLRVVAALLFGLVVVYLADAGYATVALLGALGLAAAMVAARHLATPGVEAPFQLFLLVLVGGAFALGIAVDLLTLNNDIDRMNTVFKVYLQAWVLYGLAAAAILWYLFAAGWSSSRRLSWARLPWLAALLLLLAAVGVFPVLGTRARLADRFSPAFQGLDGTEFMETASYYDKEVDSYLELRWDREAIRWLQENVRGSPVVAEGNTFPHQYKWGSRVSVYTGLPTIIGWDWHQTQQRMGEQEAIRDRLVDVTRLFGTVDEEEAMSILKRYDVGYIYVGQLERLYYRAEGLAKFDRMGKRGISAVYANPQVKVYQVSGTAR